MSVPAAIRKILLLDDDAAFLAQARELFMEMAGGRWEIHPAQNHAQALALLQKHRMALVVVDIGMPVVDGAQFLRLLHRVHPGQQSVVLTGLATDEKRRECIEQGALMVIEKPTTPGGYESVFATLDALAGADAGATGFRGMMRSLGLEEVLQMECLGVKSSVLEVFTGQTRGRIHLCDGRIVHAEKENLRGEVALYSLLALRGGEFNLLPYSEPAERTIHGQWEYLLMESARLRDEAMEAGAGGAEIPEPEAPTPSPAPRAAEFHPPTHDDAPLAQAGITEFLICSGGGDVVYEWQCASPERRLELLRLIETQAAHVAGGAPMGRFNRLEIFTAEERLMGQVLPDRRIFLRNTGGAP